MGRAPCCDKKGLKKGKWSPEEDQKLISHIQQFGHPKWSVVPRLAGLLRCGKSCRLRWTNYLRPGLKRESFTTREEEAIIQLQQILGNRWSAIATELPGRTDNDIKNHWRTHLWKRQLSNSVMASTDATDICDIIDNNNERDSVVNSEPESEYMANNLTTTTTMVAIVEEGDREKGKNVRSDYLYSEEDIWGDLLLDDSSLLMAEKSGLESLTLAASPIYGDKTNTHTWWLDDDGEKVFELPDG